MLDKELLKEMLAKKYVVVQKHPKTDLFIYNYSASAQYEKIWNSVTSQTRGLILDSALNIVARPFVKFFNLEEHKANEIPNLPFEVYEKMDGSLGILYWFDNQPYIASRGSFTSDQSLHASQILHKKYAHTFDKIDKNKTYLFEIIYPENRIVIDYGQTDDLVLLAILDTQTGTDCELEDIGFQIVTKYNGINDLQILSTLAQDNKEGFVIKFANGFRVKVKFAEYIRLHRIITNVSNVVVWEYLSEDRSFEQLLEKVPDEFFDWLENTKKDLQNQFDAILNESKAVFKELSSRKETALYFKTQKYPSVLFDMLDGRSPNKNIWKMIRPRFSKPFKNND